MKPYLTIKTVKGKKYIQISDINGNLIHIGPASKIETWSVAYQALEEAYSGFAVEEILSFKNIADEEGISLLVALDNTRGILDSEKWKAFREKQIKKRLTNYAMRQIIQGFELNDPQVLEGFNELKISLESTEKAARMVGVSPECLEKFNHLFELYEEKTEN